MNNSIHVHQTRIFKRSRAFAAFDALPSEIRKSLRECNYNISSEDMLKIYKGLTLTTSEENAIVILQDLIKNKEIELEKMGVKNEFLF